MKKGHHFTSMTFLIKKKNKAIRVKKASKSPKIGVLKFKKKLRFIFYN